MKTNKKIIYGLLIVVLMFLIIVNVCIYWFNHPTHYLYEDRWIIGRNAIEIEERYGEFDKDFGNSSGYCVKLSTTDSWGDPTWPEYYMIYFDENGKAYKVDVVVGGWGG